METAAAVWSAVRLVAARDLPMRDGNYDNRAPVRSIIAARDLPMRDGNMVALGDSTRTVTAPAIFL